MLGASLTRLVACFAAAALCRTKPLAYFIEQQSMHGLACNYQLFGSTGPWSSSPGQVQLQGWCRYGVLQSWSTWTGISCNPSRPPSSRASASRASTLRIWLTRWVAAASLCGKCETYDSTDMLCVPCFPDTTTRLLHGLHMLFSWAVLIGCRAAGLGHGHAGLCSRRGLHGICGPGGHQGHPRPQPSEPQVSLLVAKQSAWASKPWKAGL